MWKFETITDKELLRTAFAWYSALPSFLKISSGYSDKDEVEFIEHLSDGVNYAGYVDGVFAGLVFGEHRDETAVEGHCYCPRDSDPDFIAALITYAKNEALKLYRNVIVEIAVRHKTLNKLILRAGFQALGLHKWSKVVHGKLLESQLFLSVR